MNTLIFDIGKTNKKAFVFDKDFQVIDEQQTVFDETGDIDGDPTDNVAEIEQWMHKILRGYKKLNISTINFATYGATIAHLDAKGKLLATPFNYLKKIDPSIKQQFLEEHGSISDFCTATASPNLDVLLNSGFQLYWLKKTRPDFFNKIKTTLHLPQYFSYVLTGQKASEYTSIGCHTMLWDFNKKDYHDWVKQGFERLLPKIKPINTVFPSKPSIPNPQSFKVGIGIHDSSSTLLAYSATEKNPFLLLGTGTWSICQNPFNTEPLSVDEFAQDCLFYMRPDGQSVKAARLFLGKIHDEALEKILNRYNKQVSDVRNISFDEDIYDKILRGQENSNRDLLYDYLELMHQLVELQVQKIHLAAGKTPYKKIIVDGGFAKNSIYLTMLRRALPNKLITPSDMPQGTALGAALAVVNGV